VETLRYSPRIDTQRLRARTGSGFHPGSAGFPGPTAPNADAIVRNVLLEPAPPRRL